MVPISRGFGGRRRDDVDPSRIPPAQYYERSFTVPSVGPTPRTPLEESRGRARCGRDPKPTIGP
jgi:hypothetical protein